MIILLPLLCRALGCVQVCSLEAACPCDSKIAEALSYRLVLPRAVCMFLQNCGKCSYICKASISDGVEVATTSKLKNVFAFLLL